MNNKIASGILAGLMLAASLPALAEPPGMPRHYRPHHDERPVYGRPGHYHHNHRPSSSAPFWGVVGAGLALGAIALAVDTPRPPPVVVAPAVAVPPPPPPVRMWYFCESARAYYPYVAYCPEGWRAVPAAPY